MNIEKKHDGFDLREFKKEPLPKPENKEGRKLPSEELAHQTIERIGKECHNFQDNHRDDLDNVRVGNSETQQHLKDTFAQRFQTLNEELDTIYSDAEKHLEQYMKDSNAKEGGVDHTSHLEKLEGKKRTELERYMAIERGEDPETIPKDSTSTYENTILTRYKERYQKMVKLKESEKDGSALFNRIFGFSPEGQIKTNIRSTHVEFVCENQKDVKQILLKKGLHLKSGTKPMPSEEREVEHMKYIGGMVISDSNLLLDKELTDSIIIISETGAELQKEYLGDISQHEQQHIKNNLYKVARGYEVNLIDIGNISTLPVKEQEDKIKKYLRAERANEMDEAVHDEVLAHYNGLNITQREDVGKKIAANLVISYFDRFAEPALYLAKDALVHAGAKRDQVDSLAKEVFREEVRKSIISGGNALLDIQKAGFSKQEAIGLVINEKLDQWPVIAAQIKK